MRKLNRVYVGQIIRCKYPQHGTRNILCNQAGEVIKVGRSANGAYVTIKSSDGKYRTLRRDRMIDALLVRRRSPLQRLSESVAPAWR